MAQGITPDLLGWARTQLAAGYSAAALQQAQEPLAVDPVGVRPTAGGVQRPDVQQPDVQQPDQAQRLALPEPALAGAPAALDLGDRRVAVLAALAHPRVVVLGGLLAPEECAALIAAAAPRLARSRTVARAPGQEEVNPDRTSDGMFFRRGESELITRIEARIARLVRWPVENGEGLQVLHYRPGTEYKPHHDYFDAASPASAAILRRGGQRVATVVMYLNAPGRGGATAFPDVGLEVAPQRGNAVFFSYATPTADTRTLHAGRPVLAGEKWIATKWLRAGRFD